jgi:hypothetical protein
MSLIGIETQRLTPSMTNERNRRSTHAARRAVRVLLLFSVFLLAALGGGFSDGGDGAFAAKPPGGTNDPYAWTLVADNVGLVVRQQSPYNCRFVVDDTCVVNPLRPQCLWNVDDQATYWGRGYLDAGVTRSQSRCLILDNTGQTPFWLNLTAPSSDLVVTFSDDPGDVAEGQA